VVLPLGNWGTEELYLENRAGFFADLGGRAGRLEWEGRWIGSSWCTVIVVEVGVVLGNCCRPGVGKLPGFEQGLGVETFGAFLTRRDELRGRGGGKCLE
jgi:hypothetical protein